MEIEIISYSKNKNNDKFYVTGEDLKIIEPLLKTFSTPGIYKKKDAYIIEDKDYAKCLYLILTSQLPEKIKDIDLKIFQFEYDGESVIGGKNIEKYKKILIELGGEMDYNDEKEIVYVFKGEKIFPVINFLVTGTIFKSKDVTGCIHFPLYNQYQVMKQIKEFCGYFHSNKKDINNYINKFINLPFEIQKFFLYV